MWIKLKWNSISKRFPVIPLYMHNDNKELFFKVTRQDQVHWNVPLDWNYIKICATNAIQYETYPQTFWYATVGKISSSGFPGNHGGVSNTKPLKSKQLREILSSLEALHLKH